ncbi:heparinase II/III domain-containing protein [Motilibacter peucedani]|uniref:heparinase II/III domain-containing protein n=1 Tax=Motilibacter peucedani TaxID=598650 RepID=UPI000EAFB3B8|nr:heparinase II/III family protein [Motilibacter peucedani]
MSRPARLVALSLAVSLTLGLAGTTAARAEDPLSAPADLAAAVRLAAPAAAGATTAAAASPVDQAAAAAQCDLSFGKAAPTRDPADANALMHGRVVIGHYGSFRLTKDPSWRPVRTLDSSGNDHMHSLFWLLPLLREGVRRHNKAMVDRFYAVLADWVEDNPPGGRTQAHAWGDPIQQGYRALVLTCAAAGPFGTAPWLVASMKQHVAYLSSARHYQGSNNASLHQQMGVYALSAALRWPAPRAVAVRRMSALVTRLVKADGSDGEASPAYALSNYGWFLDAAERMRRVGDPIPASFGVLGNVPGFIAAATRPDGKLESLGDTSPAAVSPTLWRGTVAEFAATGGLTGPRPESVFAAYAGGYVFGRSGWGQSRPLTDETFFSLRAGARSGIPHAHDDATSLTLYSHGSPLVLDPGQWQYQYGPMRSYVIGHSAHNVVVVDGARRVSQGTPPLQVASTGDIDVATTVDRGYRGTTVTRTVAYDRAHDAIVVWDRLHSATSVRAAQQWTLGADRSVQLAADAAHTGGAGGNLDVLVSTPGTALTVASGAKSPYRGWVSSGYGTISAAPSLRSTATGTDLQWVTVLVPRAAGTSASAAASSASVGPAGLSVRVDTAAGSSVLTLDGGTGAARSGTVTPTVAASDGLVLAGTAAGFSLSGLVPGAPVSLEAAPVDGATGWAPVVAGTASAAGTFTTSAPVPVSTQFRAVSGGTASTPVLVAAAVAPTAPVVSVSAGAAGSATVSWTPPVSDGGAPLTGYTLAIGGRTTKLAPDRTSVSLTGLAPGPLPVVLTATNAVARSAAGRARADVAVYPTLVSVSPRGRIRDGHVVTLRLAGLLPGQAAVVEATPPAPAAGGAAVAPSRTRVRVAADGTAVLRMTPHATATWTVTSAGVTSSPVAITVVPKPAAKPAPKKK